MQKRHVRGVSLQHTPENSSGKMEEPGSQHKRAIQKPGVTGRKWSPKTQWGDSAVTWSSGRRLLPSKSAPSSMSPIRSFPADDSSSKRDSVLRSKAKFSIPPLVGVLEKKRQQRKKVGSEVTRKEIKMCSQQTSAHLQHAWMRLKNTCNYCCCGNDQKDYMWILYSILFVEHVITANAFLSMWLLRILSTREGSSVAINGQPQLLH